MTRGRNMIGYFCGMKQWYLLVLAFLVLVGMVVVPRKKFNPDELQAAKIELGRQMFFDKTLSNPDGQSCTVCHGPKTSFSDPMHEIVSEGMIDGAFTNRNSQSLTYISFIPPLNWSQEEGIWKGGFFWDGRSNTLVHQLSGPFFNPAEMNNTDTVSLISELRNGEHYKLYKDIYGKITDPVKAFDNMCESIALFESSDVFNEFSSKFDYWLKGDLTMTEEEMAGMNLFRDNCESCHSMDPDPVNGKILFSNFGYYNMGVPRNEKNPFYTTFPELNPLGRKAIDIGLGGVLKDPGQNGKFRVPTVRNVQYTRPYFHNGFAENIYDAVHFMNVSNKSEFGLPEVSDNLYVHPSNIRELTPNEEELIVAFLLTLSDGYYEE